MLARIPGPLTSFIKMLPLAIVGVIVAFLLAEFVFFRAVLGYNGAVSFRHMFVHDELLGWRLRTHSQGWHTDLTYSAHYATNSKGLRDREFSYGKPTTTYRILLLGDSYTEGFGVEYEKIYAKQLEVFLNQSGMGSFEVINTAVRGYGTDQQYLFFKTEGYRYYADLVMLAFVGNDENNADNMGESQPRQYFKPYFTTNSQNLVLNGVPVPNSAMVAAENEERDPVERVMRSSVTYVYIKTVVGPRWGRLLQKVGLAEPPKISVPIREESWHPDTWEVWRLVLRELRSEVERHGGRLAIVFANGSGAHERHVREISEAEGITFFDLPGHPQFAAGLRTGDLRLQHDGHWNARGHWLAATILKDFILQQAYAQGGTQNTTSMLGAAVQVPAPQLAAPG